jgi:hypothetical protein
MYNEQYYSQTFVIDQVLLFVSDCRIKDEIKIEPVSPLTLLPPSPSPSSSSSSDTWTGGEPLSEVKVNIQKERNNF